MSTMRILFVDDEPNVLEGLRRMLRKQRSEWEMEFAGSATEALMKMAANKFDVLVTDLQMPQLNGAELLDRVVEKYPDTVRIVLSGHADENVTKRAMRNVHQFLTKPTDADQLREAVAKACGSTKMVSNDRIRKAIASCDTLPSLPSLYTSITKAVESETANARTIAALLAKDMAVSAKLLQLVNSSFFGIGRRVSSVEQAVTLLGVVRIKALVLQESLVKQFVPSRELKHFPLSEFWQHSMVVAELARVVSIAERQDGERPDQAFTAGLLHDIGQLILAARETEQYEAVLQAAYEAGEPVQAAEARMMEVTHSEVGAYLLRLWGLPDGIVEAVEFHHTPERLGNPAICAVTTVHLANAFAREYEAGKQQPEQAHLATDEINLAYLESLGCAGRLEQWRTLAREKCLKAEEGAK